ncbi:Fic family protein [Protaetiibacter intestinalis]|uniref:Fic family protein n=1 Tax=Protaetiibacter intestinalis TaxID=2419774 RepID=A0A387B326_9MICO|nr:Fic family protein [Protaetiibacter intestinalis]AYF97994.1 Fic family protein [Protaetiibacter intestinalis]
MGSWPAATAEVFEWRSLARAETGPGLAEYLGGPREYTATIPASIAGVDVALPAALLAAADEAARELSRFDAELGHRVAAFAPVLLRSEAAASSQIEQLTASARAIFSAELGARGARNALLIAANTSALQAAVDLAGELGPAAIRQMHAVLMAEQPRHAPGRWREEPVWIGVSSQSPVGADFVAPPWELVPGLIDDLVAFTGRLDVLPLVSTAVAHAQFETIHPFTDGNGRTGRALAQAMLRHRAVTRSVAVPVSAGLLSDVEGYHRALTAYRAGDAEPIVARFTEASVRAVANARELVADIDAIHAGWRERVRARSDSGVWRVLDVVARTPVVDAALIARELGIRTQNAYPLLRDLTEKGVLAAKNEYRIGTLWRSEEILDAVDRFARRAGRRQRA